MENSMMIINAYILTMSGNNIENGYIIIGKDRIIDFGSMEQIENTIQSEKIILDVKGGTVIPGIIDAHCHIGINEEDVGNEGDDMNEIGTPIVPQLRVIDAINPQDIAFKEAIKSGITTVAVCPGSANVIGGQCSVIKTHGEIIDQMIIKENAAIKVALGENPKRVYSNRGMSPNSRMGIAWMLREKLFEAQKYLERKNINDENSEFEIEHDNEALIPVLKKEIPLKVHAHRADDIITALRIAKEFDVDITLEHCTQCEIVIDALSEANKPVLIGPLILFRDKNELINHNISSYLLLYKRGVKCSIISDHPVLPINYLLNSASLFLRYGLSEEEILRMLTIYPAETLGISETYGSIEIGKKANLAVFDGKPLHVESKVLYTIIDGKIVYKN